jgi:peptidoglycan/LPS O-acetylase OafA/YrhL
VRGGGNRFYLLGFYAARARRIVPALAVLCASLLLLGWFWLPAMDYRQLGQHAATALAFVSNLKFWREAGYFDAASHDKWLLHTWSLSVEWQFYLLLPLALMVLWRWWPTRRAMTGWLLAGFAASLLLSVVVTPIRPGASFYLLPTRAWEMLAGGLVFVLAGRWQLTLMQQRAIEWTGFALILGSIAFVDATDLWPGWLALFPVVGAALVLCAARTGSLWTGTWVAQRLGDASYSIYLWHWPVVVALAYLDALKNPLAVGGGLLVATVLGFASYVWVEQPSRRLLNRMNRRFSTVALAALFAVVTVPGALVYLKNGVKGRLDQRIDAVFAEAENKNPRMAECHVGPPKAVPECRYGGAELGAIVIGDSHAASVVRTVETTMNESSLHVLDWTYSSCTTLKDVRFQDPRYGDYCGRIVNQFIDKYNKINNIPLLIVNRTSSYLYGPNDIGREVEFGKLGIFFSKKYQNMNVDFLKEWRNVFIDTSCEFAKNRLVYMVRPIPELRRDVPKTMGRALLLGREERVSISLDEYHERHRLVWEAQDAASAKCGVRILDPLPYLCQDGRCSGQSHLNFPPAAGVR